MTTRASAIQVQARDQTAVMVWLMVVCGLILLMVGVGGVTRLTDSGLSITEWEPILGVIPPRNEGEWQERFDQYRAYPEYQILNRGMSLVEFKAIFFWEYLHRLLGRLVGVVFFVPFVIFLFRKAFSPVLAWLLAGAFVLGGLQGLMGWYMVQSGLVDEPHVSHFRLAAHLGLAFILFGYILWLLLAIGSGPSPDARSDIRGLRRFGVGLMALLGVQITYGAFVAGLRAGLLHTTFPKMTGYWLHPDAWLFPSLIDNLLNNPVMVQFIHRTLGWIFLALVVGFWLMARKRLDRERRSAVDVFAGLTVLQFILGVVTLMTAVPIALGTMHQVLACVLLGSLIHVLFTLRGGVTAEDELAQG